MNNNYKRAEAILYNYKRTQAEIKNLKIDLENAYDYDYELSINRNAIKPGSPTYKINSHVENEALNRVNQCEKRNRNLKQKIRRLETQNKKIDNALEVLNEEQRNIIVMRYFEGMPIADISQRLHIHPVTLNRKRKEIINNYIIDLCLPKK